MLLLNKSFLIRKMDPEIEIPIEVNFTARSISIHKFTKERIKTNLISKKVDHGRGALLNQMFSSGKLMNMSQSLHGCVQGRQNCYCQYVPIPIFHITKILSLKNPIKKSLTNTKLVKFST